MKICIVWGVTLAAAVAVEQCDKGTLETDAALGESTSGENAAEEESARLKAIFRPEPEADGGYPIDSESSAFLELLSAEAPAEAAKMRAQLRQNPLHFQARLTLCSSLEMHSPLSRPQAQRFEDFVSCYRRVMEAFTFAEGLLNDANAPDAQRKPFLQTQAWAARLAGDRIVTFSEAQEHRLAEGIDYIRRGLKDGLGCTPDPTECIQASANLILAHHLKEAPESELQAALSEVKQIPGVTIAWPDPLSIDVQLPGIRKQAIWNPADIRWLSDVAAQWHTIRDELDQYIKKRDEAAKDMTWEHQPRSSYLAGTAEWNSVDLYMSGEWKTNCLEHFPKTCAMLQGRPELDPTNFQWPASVLSRPGGASKLRVPALMANIYQAVPGARIRKHFGTHSRLVASMGLKVPPGAVLHVGNQQQTWEEGKWTLFDDAFMHEVLNNSTEPRYVLAVAMLHPECCATC